MELVSQQARTQLEASLRSADDTVKILNAERLEAEVKLQDLNDKLEAKEAYRSELLEALNIVAEETTEDENEVASDEENLTEEINPLSIGAVSPQGACEHYASVKLNTMVKIIAGINRQLSRSVADQVRISIEAESIKPDPETDTLCIMNDRIRDEILDIYRKKGWDVEVIAGHRGNEFYVFEEAK